MWKDFFFFSGSQRAGIIVLLVLISLALVALAFLPRFFPVPQLTISDDDFQLELQRFEASLVSLDSIEEARRRSFVFDDKSVHRATYFREKELPVHVERFPFDPNTLDSMALLSLGIPRFVVSNIMRYRQKGGYFSSVQRFAGVYGLTPELYDELEPYILIDAPVVEHNLEREEALFVQVELNSADSSGLLAIKGMRRGMAFSILRYRDACGGFVDINQLRDVYGMTDEQFAGFSKQLTVDSTLISPIRLNIASVDRLRAHPYLNFYQAKAMYELRRRKGRIMSLDELLWLEEIDSILLDKMSAYLSLE